MKKKFKNLMAFTLAEVLITLAIIGVVAALTIPTVISNYQKKMLVTQLKKSYNNLTNGFKTIMAQDGVTKLSDTTFWSKIPYTVSENSLLYNEECEELKKEFFKVFKVAGIFDERDLPEEQKSTMKTLNGEEEFTIMENGIILADGSLLTFEFTKNPFRARCGNKECNSLKDFQEYHNSSTKLWEDAASIEIDVNGAKGPNVWGRDFFTFTLGNDGTLYPDGGLDTAFYLDDNGICNYDDLNSCNNYWKSNSYCSASGDGDGCAGRIMEENWQMKY